MNNYEIEFSLYSHPAIRNSFAGVFALDTLPGRVRNRKPCSYVCNLSPIKNPGTHWVCVFVPITGYVEYFDSFGLEPPKELKNFMGRNEFKKNIEWIQGPLTTACGQYCMYYIYSRTVYGLSMNEIISQLKRVIDAGHPVDEYVNTSVERMFGLDLDAIDMNFLVEQYIRFQNEKR